MHLLWYLQNNLLVSENTILQIRLFAFIVYFFSSLCIILLCSQPAEQACSEPHCIRCFVVYGFFFLLIFCRLFKICLKRDKHATLLLLAYCSRNCVYKNYQHARVEYDSFCLSFIVVVFYTTACLRYIHMIFIYIYIYATLEYIKIIII
jgi:hypothetical protein